MKKLIMVATVLAIVLAMATLTTSCAKKQVRTGEQGKGPAVKSEQPAQKSAETTGAPAVSQEGDQKLRMAMQAFESENIYFDFDKSDIKPEARVILDKKADWLRSNASYRVSIEGHCDERGTNEYNLALGERRAKAAVKYLVAQGVAADRLSTISYGEERPACREKTESCWAKNRRDEFKLLK